MFILCPECGFCIGKYMQFIDAAKYAIYEEKVFTNPEFKDYAPDKMAFAAGITPTLEPLFDALRIKNRCCRMHIMAKTDFDKRYK